MRSARRVTQRSCRPITGATATLDRRHCPVCGPSSTAVTIWTRWTGQGCRSSALAARSGTRRQATLQEAEARRLLDPDVKVGDLGPPDPSVLPACSELRDTGGDLSHVVLRAGHLQQEVCAVQKVGVAVPDHCGKACREVLTDLQRRA